MLSGPITYYDAKRGDFFPVSSHGDGVEAVDIVHVDVLDVLDVPGYLYRTIHR